MKLKFRVGSGKWEVGSARKMGQGLGVEAKETGDGRQETEDRRQESGDRERRKKEKGIRKKWGFYFLPSLLYCLFSFALLSSLITLHSLLFTHH